MIDPQNRNPEQKRHDSADGDAAHTERIFVHRILRYVPNLLRDEGINVGVLLYDPDTGEYRLRLIEDTTEFNRVRRLHPSFDESVLRGLRDQLKSRLGGATSTNGNGGPIRGTLRNGYGNPLPYSTDWLQILEKWDATLSQSLQLAEQKATTADDIDIEMDRLYDERVAVIAPARQARPSQPDSRGDMRRYCVQVFRQARIWDRIEKPVRMKEFTGESDRRRIDFGYRYKKVRGFIQTVPVTRGTAEAALFGDAALQIARHSEDRFDTEFTAVIDVALDRTIKTHEYISDLFAARHIESVPLDNFAVFVAKLRPMVQ
jgi:hypothetical protein